LVSNFPGVSQRRTVTAPVPGVVSYTLIAENGPLGAPVATATHQLQTMVLPYLGIDSLEVTPQFPSAPGETVTIAWQSTGAIELELWACPVSLSTCTEITPSRANPVSGSTTYQAQTSTRFRLVIGDLLGRTAEVTAGAYFNPAFLDGLSASALQIPAGGEVTLSWSSAAATSATIDPPPPMVEEVTGSAPFLDISATGTPEPLSGDSDAGRYMVDFPGGFTFPWFGTPQTSLVATTDGWITFNRNYDSYDWTNERMPVFATPDLQLAPLWDDGMCRASTQFRYELRQTAEGQRYLVLMWKDIGFYSWPDPDGDLDYEVVLWESGEFDFRYGSMSASSSVRAAGSEATIGFQSPDRSVYHQFSHDTAVPGGLANRSWRYRPRVGGSGQLVVRPTDSTTYRSA
jgi:hypothetical protein